MSTKKPSVFETLSKVDVSDHVETIRMKKGPALKYVSWSWAWSIVKTYYPDTPTPVYTPFLEMKLSTHEEPYKVKYKGVEYTRYRTIVDAAELTNREVPYLTTPTGTMVKCTVNIQGEPYSEYLYVMDNSNKPIINPTAAEINKAQKRCLVKTLALAGLGLNLYAGEELPMGDISEKDMEASKRKQQLKGTNRQQPVGPNVEQLKREYGNLVGQIAGKNNSTAGDTSKAIAQTLKNNKQYQAMDELHKIQKAIQVAKNMLGGNN